jgi:tripartite-type tricarboxylate transporter receptor subunit TctC
MAVVREMRAAKRGYVHVTRIGAALLLCTPLVMTQARGQSAPYPGKIVRIVNPVAPGGNQDVIARAIADQLTRSMGQSVVIESRPASNALVGTRYVKGAPPDGYTLLAISNTFVRAAVVVPDAGYDPVKDFAAISLTGEVPLVLVVNPALPVKTVREFIALAKQRPGELTSASSGVGSTGHVAAEMFSRRAGIRMLNVQYKGAAPAVIDLVGGHVMLRFDQVTTSLPFIRAGKLRALGVATRTRSPALPNVPTMEEEGLTGFYDPTFNGLMAPAGTPREIVERLHAEVAKAAGTAELRNRFLDQGIELTASPSPDEFAAFLRKQHEEFAILARQTGLFSQQQ